MIIDSKFILHPKNDVEISILLNVSLEFQILSKKYKQYFKTKYLYLSLLIFNLLYIKIESPSIFC